MLHRHNAFFPFIAAISLLPFCLLPVRSTILVNFSESQQQQAQMPSRENSVAAPAPATPMREANPKLAMKMLPPQKLPPGQRILETDYFKPKEYQSQDLTRVLDGLGQQIRRDLSQAHLVVASHLGQVRRLQERMDRLERELLHGGRHRTVNADVPAAAINSQDHQQQQQQEQEQQQPLLIIFCLFLLVALILLLLVNLLLIKCLLCNNNKAGNKHIRLERSSCSELENI